VSFVQDDDNPRVVGGVLIILILILGLILTII
jgi:hypothetical protein